MNELELTQAIEFISRRLAEKGGGKVGEAVGSVLISSSGACHVAIGSERGRRTMSAKDFATYLFSKEDEE